MLQLKRTIFADPDFQQLVTQLNADLAQRDGADHPLANFNPIDDLQQVLVAYFNELPAGCGAINPIEKDIVEIKRMYVNPAHRGRGIATKLLKELEQWATELGYRRIHLFMGSKQPEAHQLYLINGYRPIPAYGKLKDIKDSICFEKLV